MTEHGERGRRHPPLARRLRGPAAPPGEPSAGHQEEQ